MKAVELFKLMNEILDEAFDEFMLEGDHEKASVIVSVQSKIAGKVIEVLEDEQKDK